MSASISSTARSFVRPRALAPGAHVRVVAPSSPFDMDQFERAVERLRARYRVTFSDAIGAKHRYLAGDDARRRAELEDAIADPSVDAIVAARGGYGAMRILPGIDPARVRRSAKLLVGFSDVTAIHALWARAGVRSIHGTMLASLGRLPEASVARWIAALEGAPPAPIADLNVLAGGSAEGPLLGGNLALLAAMVGTPLLPSLDGAILFLEDVGEAPYRIDRMLTQLLLAGALDRVAGVLVGELTRCGEGGEAHEVIAERLGDRGFPVLAGVPAGHVDDPIELPLGAPVAIDGSRGSVTFLQGAVAPP